MKFTVASVLPSIFCGLFRVTQFFRIRWTVIQFFFNLLYNLLRRVVSRPSKKIDIDGTTGYWYECHKPSSSYQPSDPRTKTITILYLHGGGFCLGHACQFGSFFMDLCRHPLWTSTDTFVRVLTIQYKLAPKHPYPAASMDVRKAYTYLLKHQKQQQQMATTSCDKGTGLSIVVMGDSAGGTLAIELVQGLGELPSPAAVVVFSPWLDLSLSSPSLCDNTQNDILYPKLLMSWRDCYVTPAQIVTASPGLGDVTTLPPTLIIAGDQELFLDEILTFRDRLNSTLGQENPHVVTIQPNRFHVYPLIIGCDKTTEEVVQFIASACSRDA